MGDRGSAAFTKGVGGPPLDGEKLEIFYEAPPGLVKEKEEDRPEDTVPDLPGNEHVRDFLAKAPSKGLWMPLGKEVKCMQCWRCKQFGHRTGDRECPLRDGGNPKSEAERQARMDPMYHLMQGKTSQHEEDSTKKPESKGQSLKDLAKQLMELQKEKKRKKREKKEKRKREKDNKKEKKEKKDKKEKKERHHHKKRRRSSSARSDSD